MSKTTYGSFKEAVDAAVRRLNALSGFDRTLVEQLVEHQDLIGRVTIQPAGDAVDSTYETYSKTIRYVIRDDLLFSLENFLDLLKHAAGFSVALMAFMNPAGVPAAVKGIIDAVHGLAASYRKIVNQGHRPTPEEFAILTTLKDMSSGTTTQIANVLKGVDAATVEQVLTKYQETADRKTGFVKRDGEGRWQLVGF